MSVGNVTRVIAVVAACAAAAGSATSGSNQGRSNSSSASSAGPGDQSGPPPAQQMEAGRALGVWRSTFGAVKIEADNSHGGLSSGSLQGVWVYQRQGQEVIGYFAGALRGNILQFRWQEPNNPPLTGEGYLVFDVQGRQYTGRWWSDKRDRIGDWNGWRQSGPEGVQQAGADPGQYGGQDGYGAPPRQPSPYQQQPSPYQQPSQPSPYQQQPSPYQQPSQPSPYQQQPSQPSPYQQQPSPYQQPSQPSPYQQQPSSQTPPPTRYN